MDLIVTALKETWSVTQEMAPYLLFGFLAAGLLSVLIRPETVQRHLGKGSFSSVFKAALFGIPLPICSCGVVPVTASLKDSGASRGASTAFLISTPQTGVDSILATYSLLGPVYAIFRPLAALASGILGGSLVNAFAPEEKKPVKDIQRTETNEQVRFAYPLWEKAKEVIRYGLYALPRSLGKSLLIGLLIAGIITAVIPDDFFMGILGTGIGAMLAMLVLGIPIYVCATASVPIAAALIAKGISPGAALVFLVTGPATNTASLAVIWKVIGKKASIIYLASTALAALASGFILDYIFSQTSLHPMHIEQEVHEMAASPLKTLSAIALLIILGIPFLPGCGKKEIPKTEPAEASMSITLTIEGMTCEHCVKTITRTLSQISGVTSAEVFLGAKEAVVSGNDLDKKALKEAVEDKGYKVIQVE